MKMCFTPNIALFLRHDPPPIPPATSRATNSSDPPRSPLPLQPAAHHTLPSFKNIGTVFSRSLAAPSPRPSQITSDSLHHERDRMTRQLRHRKTMARGREERHIRNSWPTAPFAWTVSSRKFVSHHRDEGVSATRSALLSHCLLPLCCAARTPRTPHAALALLPLVPRTRRRTTGTRQHARTTTHDDEKMLRAHTGTKPKTPIDGASENLVVAPATGPRCARGPLPFSSHASVA